MRDIELPWRLSAENPSQPAVAVVRELTGEEEDLFLDRKKMEDGRSVNNALLNCCQSIDGVRPTYEDITALKMCDRRALALGIRAETYGDNIKASLRCASCGKRFPVELSLAAVEDRPTSRDRFSETGEYTFALSDGTQCTYRMMDGNMERGLRLAAEEERVTYLMLAPLVRVVQPDGKELPPNDKKKWLKRISMKYREEIRVGMMEHEFGPDTTFIAPCPECDHENEGLLEQLPGFFFPQKSMARGTR